MVAESIILRSSLFKKNRKYHGAIKGLQVIRADEWGILLRGGKRHTFSFDESNSNTIKDTNPFNDLIDSSLHAASRPFIWVNCERRRQKHGNLMVLTTHSTSFDTGLVAAATEETELRSKSSLVGVVDAGSIDTPDTWAEWQTIWTHISCYMRRTFEPVYTKAPHCKSYSVSPLLK